MEQAKSRLMTAQEYFEREESAFEKSEFLDGELFAMTGASVNHNLICANLIALLVGLLKDRCLVFPGDIKVQIEAGRHYVYPDVSVVCGAIEYGMGRNDVIANPIVIFEVLSPCTQAYDYGYKFAAYRELPSLQEYIPIHQHQVMVDQYSRQSPDLWQLRIHRRITDSLQINAVEASLPLAEVYRNVRFEAEA